MKQLEELIQVAEFSRDDAEKALKGNKSASLRLRKACRKIKELANEIRTISKSEDNGKG